MLLKKIKNNQFVKYLNENRYSHLWYKLNDPNSKYFIRKTETFGIYHNKALVGVFALESQKYFYEPHLFIDKKIRGKKIIDCFKSLLLDYLLKYPLMIARIKKKDKHIQLFIKWIGFRKFKEDDQYIFFGIDIEQYGKINKKNFTKRSRIKDSYKGFYHVERTTRLSN